MASLPDLLAQQMPQGRGPPQAGAPQQTRQAPTSGRAFAGDATLESHITGQEGSGAKSADDAGASMMRDKAKQGGPK